MLIVSRARGKPQTAAEVTAAPLWHRQWRQDGFVRIAGASKRGEMEMAAAQD